MCVTHNRLGLDAANWRSTRSLGRSTVSSVMVVRLNLPRRTPTSPRLLIRRATRSRPTSIPSRLRCFQAFFAP